MTERKHQRVAFPTRARAAHEPLDDHSGVIVAVVTFHFEKGAFRARNSGVVAISGYQSTIMVMHMVVFLRRHS